MSHNDFELGRTLDAEQINAEPRGGASGRAASHSVPLSPDSEKNVRNTETPQIGAGWWLEIASWTFSTICFAAICIVLAVFDHRASPYLPSNITLNTVISILAALARVALVLPVSQCISQMKWLWFSTSQGRTLLDWQDFDNGSKGGLGILGLVTTRRYWPWAPLCAILLAFFVTIEPFTQQAIVYVPVLGDNALGQIASSPSALTWNFYDDPPQYAETFYQPDLPTQAAIYNGLLYGNTSITPLAPTCSSGNCTWANPYSSLAVCAITVNLTDQITTYRPGPNAGQHYINYTVPGGATLTWGEDTVKTVAVVSMMPGGLSNQASAVFSQETPGVLADFVTIFQPNAADDGYQVKACETMLRLCIQTYATQVTSGIATTNVLSWSTDFVQDDSEGNIFTSHDDQKYTLGSEGYMVLAPALSSLFQGDYGIFQGNARDEVLTTSLPVQAIAESIYNPPYDIAGINQVAQNIATSLTNHFRLSNGSTATATIGNAQQESTHIFVRWPWLTLLAACICLSFLCLIFLIVKTKQARLMAWKSTPVAPFFMTGFVEAESGALGLGKVPDAEASARQIHVELVSQNGSWMLRRLTPARTRVGRSGSELSAGVVELQPLYPDTDQAHTKPTMASTVMSAREKTY